MIKAPNFVHMYFEVLQKISDIGAPANVPAAAVGVVFKMAAM